MNKKKYFDELNIFRGLVIIWITLGHSTLLGDDFSSFNVQSFLHGYAYSFHMSAMFVLSGILFARKLSSLTGLKNKSHAIVERFGRLMVPYFFYTAVSYVLKMLMEKYAYNPLQTGFGAFISILFGVNNPNGGLWFLNALFFISIIAILVNKIDIRITFAFALAANIFTYMVDTSSFYISAILEYSVYFFLGVLLMSRGTYEKLSNKISAVNNKLLFSTISIICLTASFVLTGINLFIWKNEVLSYFISYINIVVWYIIASAISINSKFTKKFTMCIGNYGMDIYMIGYYVQISLRVVMASMLGLDLNICSVAMFIGALLIPIPISKYIIRKFKITNAILLGDFKPFKRKKNNEKA